MDPMATSRYRGAPSAASLEAMNTNVADFVVLPIVIVASLVAWLFMVYWANSHPLHRTTHRWRTRR
jgi:hypothetical protein